MEEIVKGTWFMKGDCPKEEIEEFFKEYEDGEYIIVHDYIPGVVEQTGEPVWVVYFSALQSTFDWFIQEFGKTSTIRKGWDQPNGN